MYAVESTGLENRSLGNRTVGSLPADCVSSQAGNPTPSASFPCLFIFFNISFYKTFH